MAGTNKKGKLATGTTPPSPDPKPKSPKTPMSAARVAEGVARGVMAPLDKGEQTLEYRFKGALLWVKGMASNALEDKFPERKEDQSKFSYYTQKAPHYVFSFPPLKWFRAPTKFVVGKVAGQFLDMLFSIPNMAINLGKMIPIIGPMFESIGELPKNWKGVDEKYVEDADRLASSKVPTLPATDRMRKLMKLDSANELRANKDKVSAFVDSVTSKLDKNEIKRIKSFLEEGGKKGGDDRFFDHLVQDGGDYRFEYSPLNESGRALPTDRAKFSPEVKKIEDLINRVRIQDINDIKETPRGFSDKEWEIAKNLIENDPQGLYRSGMGQKAEKDNLSKSKRNSAAKEHEAEIPGLARQLQEGIIVKKFQEVIEKSNVSGDEDSSNVIASFKKVNENEGLGLSDSTLEHAAALFKENAGYLKDKTGQDLSESARAGYLFEGVKDRLSVELKQEEDRLKPRDFLPPIVQDFLPIVRDFLPIVGQEPYTSPPSNVGKRFSDLIDVKEVKKVLQFIRDTQDNNPGAAIDVDQLTNFAKQEGLQMPEDSLKDLLKAFEDKYIANYRDINEDLLAENLKKDILEALFLKTTPTQPAQVIKQLQLKYKDKVKFKVSDSGDISIEISPYLPLEEQKKIVRDVVRSLYSPSNVTEAEVDQMVEALTSRLVHKEKITDEVSVTPITKQKDQVTIERPEAGEIVTVTQTEPMRTKEEVRLTVANDDEGGVDPTRAVGGGLNAEQTTPEGGLSMDPGAGQQPPNNVAPENDMQNSGQNSGQTPEEVEAEQQEPINELTPPTERPFEEESLEDIRNLFKEEPGPTKANAKGSEQTAGSPIRASYGPGESTKFKFNENILRNIQGLFKREENSAKAKKSFEFDEEILEGMQNLFIERPSSAKIAPEETTTLQDQKPTLTKNESERESSKSRDFQSKYLKKTPPKPINQRTRRDAREELEILNEERGKRGVMMMMEEEMLSAKTRTIKEDAKFAQEKAAEERRSLSSFDLKARREDGGVNGGLANESNNYHGIQKDVKISSEDHKKIAKIIEELPKDQRDAIKGTVEILTTDKEKSGAKQQPQQQRQMESRKSSG